MIYFSLFQLILGFCSAYLKKVLAVFLLGLETCITCLGCINLSKLAGNDMIYLTAIGQPPGGSSTVHIYTQTIHRTTQKKQYIDQHRNQEECGPCPVFAGFTLAFPLQLRKSTEKSSVRVAIIFTVWVNYKVFRMLQLFCTYCFVLQV